MASTPAYNVPSADFLKRILRHAFASESSKHPVLAPTMPALHAADEALDAATTTTISTEFATAKLVANAKDEVFDDLNRMAIGLLEALRFHRDEGIRAAALYLLTLLFPDRLAVVNLSWTLEAASASSFELKRANATTQQHVATLAPILPTLDQCLKDIVAAAEDLGRAIDVLDGFETDKAGRPVNPKLFEARNEAHRLFAAFANSVETFAFPSESPEDRRARADLLGAYRRFLADVPRSQAAAGETAPVETGETTTTDTAATT